MGKSYFNRRLGIFILINLLSMPYGGESWSAESLVGCFPFLKDCIGDSQLENTQQIERDTTPQPLLEMRSVHISKKVTPSRYRPEATVYKKIRGGSLLPKLDSVRVYDYHDIKVANYEPTLSPKFIGSPIGRDERIRIYNTDESPWRMHGHLEMIFPNKKFYIGSGTLISPYHVLTAGHCLYNSDYGGWAESITFTPGQNGERSPFGSVRVTHLITVKGWVEEEKGEWDFGMLILDKDIGNQTGWCGILSGSDKYLHNLSSINVTGYPGSVQTKGYEERINGTQMWTMEGVVKKVTAETFSYKLDTSGGQSGSGVWTKLESPYGYYCTGIHTYGYRKGEEILNHATRISDKKFDCLVNWMEGSLPN
ncbi:trypsin-like serine peptidase [Candidatus Odyssella acanthamoebae]|uniref:trypsin-like serine peptidase n=1 Tax=Candidatus Odyssella acanthamoebae TaxID=91604 RepID=UPI00068F1789|nr:trypsin-like serine protease [Candidatus Paracaedibacter acanthamoebae]